MATSRHQQKPYPLRIPDELRDRLDAAAKAAGRSLNAEMALRLEESLKPEPGPDLNRDFLTDVIFADFEDEEASALAKIDRESVEGMVEWLELVDSYRQKRAKLEAMVNEALAIYEQRKAEKAKKPSKPRKGKEGGNG